MSAEREQMDVAETKVVNTKFPYLIGKLLKFSTQAIPQSSDSSVAAAEQMSHL
ncbi:MAG TPA: hypothetical protein VMB21_07885 [Candidatus Limnocylindria bacterium]|jgi:hypothetical protein|nr:hypothetical protein [Candidatus Limnocylindria bacterium]